MAVGIWGKNKEFWGAFDDDLNSLDAIFLNISDAFIENKIEQEIIPLNKIINPSPKKC